METAASKEPSLVQETRAVTSYSEFAEVESPTRRIRRFARDCAVFGLSLPRAIDRTAGWVRFPYYHHVFDDERAGFEKQLDYLKRFGDFVSLDDAIDLIDGDAAIEGRFFCLTFDDGFKSCSTNAMPILGEREIPSAVFVPTALVGTTTSPHPENEGPGAPPPVEYVTWDDCREMAAAGMQIESHAHTHHRLGGLGDDEVRREMRESKEIIEREMEAPARHFCCPFGSPGRDFLTDREPKIAADLGYASFSTGVRGKMSRGDDPFYVTRDHLLANWGNYQLRYFLSL